MDQRINKMIYVSLSTIPQRIRNLNKTVQSLLTQTKKPDKIFVNIPFKYKNSLSGLIINIFLLPNFIFAYYFYDKSFYLGIFVSLYLVIYLIIYFFLSKTINN